MTRLAEMFNVNHFIVSQVNPHVVPFIVKEEAVVAKGAQELPLVPTGPTWLQTLSHMAKGEALHRMHTLSELGVFPNLLTKAVSVLSQKYSGDITILPEISYADFPRMLSNPTPEFMHGAMLSGERATWPKISIIKNHCAIELALDDAVQKLRTRVVFSPSEVESRMNAQVQRNSITGSQKRVRRRTSRRRPLSQNSAQEPLQRPSSSHASPFAGSIPLLHTTHKGASRIASTLRHKKSRSINNVVTQPSAPLLTPDTERTSPDFLATPKASHDVTSSGADETSNLTSASSSTSLSLSSQTESPSSPVEQELPPKWRRSLFGSSSQPSTPSQFSALTSPVLQQQQMTPNPSHPAFAMTPANKTPPDSKYKRFFSHSGQSSAAKLFGGARDTSPRSKSPSSGGSGPESSGKASKRNWGLEIDIPSTAKGLVGRGKKKSGE